MITKNISIKFNVRNLSLLSEFYIYRILIKLRGVWSLFKKLGRGRDFIPI